MPLDITLSEQDIKRIRGSNIDCPSCAILLERIEDAKAGEALIKLIQKGVRSGTPSMKSEVYIQWLREAGYTLQRAAREAEEAREDDSDAE